MLEFLGALFNFLIHLLAVLLCLLFVATIIIVLLLVNADSMLLSPDLYQTALARERIYERLPALAAEQIYMQMHYQGTGQEAWSGSENPLQSAGPEAVNCARTELGEPVFQDILGGLRRPTTEEMAKMAGCGVGAASGGEGGPPVFFQALTIEQWASVLGTLLPPEWLKSQTESILQQAFQLVDTPGAPLEVKISLVELKARLNGPAGMDVLTQLLNALPPCESGFIPDISNPGQMLECRPSDALLELFKPLMQQVLADSTKNIPDSVNLLEPLTASGLLTIGQSEIGLGPRQLLQAGRWVVRLSPILCIGILLLVALLVVRSWKGLLRWWGLSILAAGLAVVITAILMWIGMDVLLSLGRENLPANLSPSLYDTLGAILVFIGHRYALVTGGEGIVLGVIGLGLVIGAFFLGRVRKPQPPAPPVPAVPQRLQEPPEHGGIFG